MFWAFLDHCLSKTIVRRLSKTSYQDKWGQPHMTMTQSVSQLLSIAVKRDTMTKATYKRRHAVWGSQLQRVSP